jgi:uncharacterized membrane protein YjjP (DUF1212 family)
LNDAVSASVMRLIDQVCAGTITATDATTQMQALKHVGSVHGRWPLAFIFALAAAALACILQADVGAIVVSAISSALGLLARKELGKRHWPLFSLPFVAAVIAGVVGGVAIRAGFTRTTGLCLIVPVLMLVPGPHLINGLADIFENHIQTGICRLVLAAGILLSAAMGVMAGAWLIMGLHDVEGTTSGAIELTLGLDMILAGVAACGFGAFYNSPWRVLWISIVCGMIGHGIRFVCLAEGVALPASTFIACAAIGLLASMAIHRLRLPFSSVAFAAAVPMMPGSLIYRNIAGAVKLAMSGTAADPHDATAVFVLLLQAGLTIGAMAAGLMAGALVAAALHHLAQRRAISP